MALFAARRTTRRAPRTHHKRKTTIVDKVSGALTKLKGKLTHNPAKVVSFLQVPKLSVRTKGVV